MCRPFCFNAFEQPYFKDILCFLHSPGIFHVLYTMLKRSRLMIRIRLIHFCLSSLTVPVSQLQDTLPANYFACRMNYRFPRYFSSSPSFSSSSTHCKQCLLLVIIIIIIVSIITVFTGVLFVHQPGANHAPRASVT